MRKPTRSSLPLHLWLLILLALVISVPLLAGLCASTVIDAWRQHAQEARIEAIRGLVGTDPSRWTDPLWQTQLRQAMDHQGVELGLVNKRSGQVLFVTRSAQQLMLAFSLAPANSEALKASIPTQANPPADGSPPPTHLDYQKIDIVDTSLPAGQLNTIAVANVWFGQPLGGMPPSWLSQAIELAALLAVVLWMWILARRMVIAPLDAIQQGMVKVGEEIGNFQIAESQVREVHDLIASFRSMDRELKQARQRRETIEQERRFLIRAVTHDLRTPLFTLSSYLAGLREGIAATPERSEHYLAICQEQTALLDQRITDLFTFTQVEYQDQDLPQAVFDWNEMMGGVIQRLVPFADTKGTTIDPSGSVHPISVFGNESLLSRAIENLIGNAIAYTPPNGQITVGWGQEGDMLVFSIADNGPGIPEADLSQIFTPFFRGEASRNRNTGGAGLGLAIALRIVQIHRGKLHAENRLEGGAVFFGSIPLNRLDSNKDGSVAST